MVPVRDGGFDPVAVPARPGDRLELAILGGDGETHVVYLSVPSRRPPTVVRTNPRRGRTDVALSVQIVAVFSEPIDPETLTPSSVRLLRDDTPVAGEVALVPGSPFMAQFVPDALLEPGIDYELVVTTAILDLDGDALEEEYRVEFRTTSNPTVGPANIAIVSGDQQQGSAGRELAEPFVVRVTDAQGAAIPGAAVTWSVERPWGVLDGRWDLCPGEGEVIDDDWISVTVKTDAEGVATMSYVPTSISRKWVRAELAEFDTVRVYFRVDASDAGASVEIVSGNDQEVSAGSSFEGKPLVVRVKDGRGAPVPNVTAIWGVPSSDVVLGNACSRTVIDWSEEEEAFTASWTFWYVRTGADGTAAVEFRPRAVGTSEVSARAVGMTDGVTFTIEATSLVIGLSRDPSDGGAPTFLSPHLTSDAGVPVGGVVEFWNRESTARIVSTSSPAGGALFDSGPLQRDERFRFVPDVAGTWEFVDEVSGATGTLTARSADSGHGAVLVSNVTTGGAFDPDGYRVTIRAAGHPPRTDALELNTGIQVPQVAAGPATVEVHDLASNCAVTGSPIRSVTWSGTRRSRSNSR